jgi:hypothetical protein
MKPRARSTPGRAAPAALPPPHVIIETAVYTTDQARAALGLRKATLRREIRLGRLRVSRRAGRYFTLGSWLLEWIRAGEKRPRDDNGDAGDRREE